MNTRKAYRWLLWVPFVWQAALAPWSNGVQWRPLGLPFPMAWQMAGILVTTAVLWCVYRFDQAAAANDSAGNNASSSTGSSTGSSAGAATGDTAP